MISSNFDTKVDRAFKILVFTKSNEIRSNDVHVKQMMLNAIHATLSIFFYEYNSITKLSLKLIYYLVLYLFVQFSAHYKFNS